MSITVSCPPDMSSWVLADERTLPVMSDTSPSLSSSSWSPPPPPSSTSSPEVISSSLKSVTSLPAHSTLLLHASSNSYGVTIGWRKSLLSTSEVSGQATSTNTSISGKFASLATLGLPTRNTYPFLLALLPVDFSLSMMSAYLCVPSVPTSSPTLSASFVFSTRKYLFIMNLDTEMLAGTRLPTSNVLPNFLTLPSSQISSLLLLHRPTTRGTLS